MKYVPKSITRAVGNGVLRTKMHSPSILFVTGVVGFGATVVLACKATMSVEDILVSHEKQKLEVERARISEAQSAHESRRLMIQTTAKLARVYAPTVVVGVLSVACLTKSHKLLTERNTQLTAAYVGLQKFLESYRGRVREKVGEEEERNIYYASTPVELAQDGENGPEKVFGTRPGHRSPYSQLFAEGNGNWQIGDTFNRHFLNIQEDHLTNRLRSQGSLMLNEVYDVLDMPRTPTGALVGWKIGHPDSDDFIEFTVTPLHDGHGSLMVDFNVAGVVYDMLSGRISRGAS